MKLGWWRQKLKRVFMITPCNRLLAQSDSRGVWRPWILMATRGPHHVDLTLTGAGLFHTHTFVPRGEDIPPVLWGQVPCSHNQNDCTWSRQLVIFEGALTGFRVQGPGFRVQGSGFRVQGSGFRVQGSGFRVQDRSRSELRHTVTYLAPERVLTCRMKRRKRRSV